MHEKLHSAQDQNQVFKFEVTIYAITASTAANGGDENDDDDGKKCDNCFDKRSHQCEKKFFNTLCWRQKKRMMDRL